ncbi:MAG TPA: carboxypeptidase-like regulatory domain-containing protein [Acidobacteriaceae bacterium]|nr:carboxypeptidase-like regulatory domain-containing protein [Acidobacteriaceae bacterium]
MTTSAAAMMTKRSEPVERRRGRRSWLLMAAAVIGLMAAGVKVWAAPAKAGASAAADNKIPQARSIEGVVVGDTDAPVQGAVVYLQDSKSMSVKSYLSDDAGHFHFGQLSLTTDYDLWAELNGKRSKTRTISQFNSRPDLHFTLKLPK